MSDISSAEKFSIFFPLYKVEEQDDGTLMLWTRGTQEIIDGAGEIMDYASTVPLIKAWSAAAEKRSGGKSKGNIRAMHQPSAAGLLKDINFLDGELAVDLCVKVVDQDAINKVREGVYTGASMGGAYLRKWPDPKTGRTRYTGRPIEFSLVDAPSVHTATFQMVKADGLIIDVPFQASEADQAALPVVPSVSEVPASVEPELLQEFIKSVSVLNQIRQEDRERNEKQELLLKSIGSAVGIHRRDNEPLLAPNGGPNDPDEYGDPANFSFLMDEGNLKKSVTRFNKGLGLEKYSLREANILGRRISRLASRFGEIYKYDPLTKVITAHSVTKENNMADEPNTVKKLDIGALRDQVSAIFDEAADQIAQNPEAVRQLLVEMLDSASLASTSGNNPSTPVPDNQGEPLDAKKEKAEGKIPAPDAAKPEVSPADAAGGPEKTPDEKGDEKKGNPFGKADVEALNKRLDQITALVEKLATDSLAKAAAAPAADSPLANLNGLLNKTPEVSPVLLDPVYKALMAGGPYAMFNAIKATGMDGPMAMAKVNDVINQASFVMLEQGGVITASRFKNKIFNPGE